MKIAILGWGSLIWNPGNLEIEKTQEQNGWFDDGPMMPIEFARISKNKRLTLVIVPGSEEVRTLYAISKFEILDEAILDLAVREGCGKNKVGFFDKKKGEFYPPKFEHKNNIKDWINDKEDVDAVIWTDLANNFKDKVRLELTADNVINYLEDLLDDVKALSEQYIRRAPVAVNTPFRKEIEKKLGWSPIKGDLS